MGIREIGEIGAYLGLLSRRKSVEIKNARGNRNPLSRIH
jgi:hypothetical protein